MGNISRIEETKSLFSILAGGRRQFEDQEGDERITSRWVLVFRRWIAVVGRRRKWLRVVSSGRF
jgi:hypothetical protein